MPARRKSEEESSGPKAPARKTAGGRVKSKTAAQPRAKAAVASGTKGGRSRANGSGGHATVRPATSEPRLNEKAPVAELAARTAQDYREAKKALGTLWQDAAKTTYSAFNSIALSAERQYEESRKAISEIDVRYALDKTQEKLKHVGKSASATAQTMARQVKLLYQMLKDSTAGRFQAPWPTVAAITAALLYFISPIDLVPDFIPGLGFIDDALVIALCISVIRMDLRRYAEQTKLDLSDYGLKK